MAKQKVTDEELRGLKAEFEKRLAELEKWRGTLLRDALADGRQQKDLIDQTGYSREAIRQYLKPEARAIHNRRRTKAGRTAQEDS